MNYLFLSLLTELSLALGVAGLFWPDKLLPLFEVLLFPWAASRRMIRAHSIGTIAAALLLFFKLINH
jgi:hypothetical protein